MPPDNPLNADEYAPGRRVRLNGLAVDVRDEIRGASGSTYLVVGQPDNDVCALLPAALVRDEAEAIDPDDVQRDRERAAADDGPTPDDTPAPTAPGGTGATGGTGPVV